MSQSKRILVFGTQSLIGEGVSKELKKNHNVTKFKRKNFNFKDTDKLKSVVCEKQYDIIIYAAGLNDPEICESEEEKTIFLNTEVPDLLSKIIFEFQNNCKFIYFSDVLIFNGEKESSYTEVDIPQPLNIYGESKYNGEKKIIQNTDKYIIIRTSWLYGKKMKGIFKKILEIFEQKDEILAVDNFFGNPTYVNDLGSAINFLIQKDFNGIINVASNQCVSWYNYTKDILNFMLKDKTQLEKIKAQSSDGSNVNAKRPLNSCLNSNQLEKLGYTSLDYKNSLKIFMNNLI